MSEVIVVRDALEVAQVGAELFTESSAGATAARGKALVVLTGGSAAPPLYAALRSDPWRTRVPWASIEFFYSDDRAVPLGDPLSNHGMAQRELHEPLGIAPERVHRFRGEVVDLDAEARRAADELREIARPPMGGPPRLDLVLLGLGPDGHIGSLFAGAADASDRGDAQLVKAVPAPTQVEPHVPRFTLTPAPIVYARTIVLMTTGAKKAEVLARMLKGPDDLKACPAQWLRRATGRVVVVCDEAAAARL